MARKILLADDSVTAQNMGRKILADAGYDVVTVNNGSAALKRVAEIKPDLIVLDVYMPGYSGLEVCQRLKDSADTEHIPILLTVGKLEPFKPEEARRVRADAHIIKPFEASELLTAITKLEDRMVPSQPDGSRFSASVSGVERFAGDGKKSAETDTSWKSRLRFPSKKKKEEPQAEPEDAEAANYRDFRKGKSKSTASAPFKVKTPPPPGQEPGLVPDIPRDITPEELDALSALAAKLDGPIPAAENIAPLAEKMGPPAAPVAEVSSPLSQVQVEEARSEAAAPVTEAVAQVPSADASGEEKKAEEKKEEIVATAPEAAPVAMAPAVAEFVVEAPAAPVEVPVAHTEPAPQAELKEVQKSETADTAPVSAGSFVEEPAPIDRTDEPAFASVVSEPQAANSDEGKPSEPVQEKPAEAAAETQAAAVKATTEAIASEEGKPVEEVKAAEVKAEESRFEESTFEGSTSGESKAVVSENVKSQEEVAAIEPEPQGPVPTDEELAEALRLLTPSAGHAEASSVPSHGTLAAAGQLLAEEAARNASGAPRWEAQPVALSAEEAALSLEAEMQAFAATAATLSGASNENADSPATAGVVSVIEGAIDNRLASMDLVSPAPSLTGQEAAATRESVAQSEPGGKVGNTATPFVVANAREAAPTQPAAPEKAEAACNEPQSAMDEAAESAPVTFADAVGVDGTEPARQDASAAQKPGSFETRAAETEEQQASSSDVGEQESMAKGKAGKSNWHQIHTAAPAGKDVVEAAKDAQPAPDEAPKVMAAAAAAEGTSATPVPDAGTIASIVDSVMADLRPKIVEEIAKKLAGK